MAGKDCNKIMLGFIVRRCAAELGHAPTADEFAAWANGQEENGRRYSLFGQPISSSDARVMFRHMGRLVTVRSGRLVIGPKVPGGGEFRGQGNG